MKKLIALLLCLLMMLSVLASCSDRDENEDKGPVVPVYITTEVANFDPAYANLDDGALKLLGLLYEGLFKIDRNGNVVMSGAKSVKVLDKPDDNYYAIEITMKTTSWSDDTEVQAADYVFAWKRILESDFRGEAASMLMEIKNARAVKAGDASIDDLGITDVATNVIRIEFEGPTDYDRFYGYLASPMLFPLRENVLGRVEKDWSSSAMIVVSNGPFVLRGYSHAEERMVLERNIYYYRDVEDDSISKYVKPFRLEVSLTGGPSANLEAYKEGKIVYDGELPLDQRGAYADSVKTSDTLSILSCLFNTTKSPLNNASVRRALSLALDRNQIVSILTFAKPAEGLIDSAVYNVAATRKGKTFREVGGSLIASGADVGAARSLLQSAGVSGGSITLVCRNNEADAAVAAYIKGVWESLGFTVTVDAKSLSSYQDEKEYDLVSDSYFNAYEAGDFDAILVDFTMPTVSDAFPALAQFAKPFAGGKMNMDVAEEDYELTPHVSGYDSEAYNAKLEEVFAAAGDREARAALLHEAEALLLNEMPIAPLVELQHAALYAGDLNMSKNAADLWGCEPFASATLKNRSKYEETEAE